MAKEKQQIKKRLGETLYPGEKIITRTVGLTPTQVNFLDQDAVNRGWTRSRLLQYLTDQYMKKREKEEEARI